MKLTAANKLVSDTLTAARQKLAEAGAFAEQNIAEELEDGSGYLYGALVTGQDLVKEDECLFFPIDLSVNSGEVSEEEAYEATEDFLAKVDALCQKLSESEDKAEVILKFGEEIQKTRELELLGQVKDLEKDTTHNLKIALSAGAVMLVLAAICIIISRLL